jgi:hypothetical protein
MTEFIGLPIEGDINRFDAPVNQKPIEELAALMREVLDSGVVKAVRWYQYTPYFNDGEPCVFGVHGVYFNVDGDYSDEEDYENEARGEHGDGFVGDWDNAFSDIFGGRSYDPLNKWTEVPGSNPELGKKVKDLQKAIEDGTHFVEMANLFGDHARVTATTTKFIVDEYEHD